MVPMPKYESSLYCFLTVIAFISASHRLNVYFFVDPCSFIKKKITEVRKVSKHLKTLFTKHTCRLSEISNMVNSREQLLITENHL